MVQNRPLLNAGVSKTCSYVTLARNKLGLSFLLPLFRPHSIGKVSIDVRCSSLRLSVCHSSRLSIIILVNSKPRERKTKKDFTLNATSQVRVQAQILDLGLKLKRQTCFVFLMPENSLSSFFWDISITNRHGDSIMGLNLDVSPYMCLRYFLLNPFNFRSRVRKINIFTVFTMSLE